MEFWKGFIAARNEFYEAIFGYNAGYGFFILINVILVLMLPVIIGLHLAREKKGKGS